MASAGVWRMLSVTGLHRLVHRRLFGGEVAILMYHGVVKEPLHLSDWCFMAETQFRREMSYLKRHFDVVSLQQAVDRLAQGDIRRPTAVITFDDGYQNNYDVAFPVLSELGLPATIFLVTSLIDTDKTLWFCRLNQALDETSRRTIRWGAQDYDLSTHEAKAKASEELQRRSKLLLHDVQQREVTGMVRLLGGEAEAPVESGSPYRMLNRDSILAMSHSGLIDFGAHSTTHTILTRVSREQQRREILFSLREVTEMTDKPCRFFAYPNGRAGDYDEQVIDILHSAGAAAAVTTREGPNTQSTPGMELRRYGMGAATSSAVFECTVHHLYGRLSASQRQRAAEEPDATGSY